MRLKVRALRRRRRLPERITLVCEWTLHDPIAEARARELARYYGSYGECAGMGV